MTSFQKLAPADFHQKQKLVASWDTIILPRSLRAPAKSSSKGSWHPRSPSLASPSTWVRIALQVRWLIAWRRQHAKKRWENTRSPTTLGQCAVAIPPAGRAMNRSGQTVPWPPSTSGGGRMQRKWRNPQLPSRSEARRTRQKHRTSSCQTMTMAFWTSKPHRPPNQLAPPPYEGKDPDIDGRSWLDGLDRLNRLDRGVFGLTILTAQSA